MALKLKARLESALGVELPASVLFSHPSIDSLAGYLVETHFSAGAAENGVPSPGGLGQGEKEELLIDPDQLVQLTEHEVRERAAQASELLGREEVNRLRALSPERQELLLFQLARLVQARQAEPGSERGDARSLAADAVLEPGVCPPSARPAEQPAEILLTGATGFLGGFLLAELLRQTPARVWCPVRAGSDEQARARLRTALEDSGGPLECFDRVEALAADLSRPRLGLSEPRFAELAERLDAVYHNGASTNLTAPYAVLRPINVLGTHEVLRLAAAGRPKAFHHISSLSVFLAPDSLARDQIREEDAVEGGLSLPNGYARTKWVGERLVRAFQERGAPTTIHRIGIIACEGRNGRSKAGDWVPLFLKGCVLLGLAPELGDDPLDFLPVEYAAAAVVHLARQPALWGRAFHLLHTRPPTWRQVLERLGELGHPLPTAPPAEWLARVERQPASNPLVMLLPWVRPLISRRSAAFVLPRVDMRNTSAGLAGAGLNPGLPEPLVDRFLSYLIQTGFLPPVAAGVAKEASCPGR
jgi:thioester reductase-like protein